ncbi:MAG: AAA family ATPase, partial [Candidatus Aenigmarchaeota archaeon]|nr:AAA family ATPase [Candidatus Aenigmarchaeota archaeon]
MILLISGTPAAGKTTVAEVLGEKLGWRVISLNDLARERNLYCG